MIDEYSSCFRGIMAFLQEQKVNCEYTDEVKPFLEHE